MKKLSGKVAFITGGSRGIGAGIVKRLAAEGAEVVFTHSGRSKEKADALQETIKSSGVNCTALIADNESPDSLLKALQTTVEKYGRVDILVNNAGIGILKTIEEHTLEDFEKLIAVHVKAIFVSSKFAATHMPAGGRIINIGSNMADRVAFSGGSLYSMSKSALTGLTKGFARDLGDKNITVNLVQPGPVNTDMNPEDGPYAPSMKTMMAIKRYGTAEEVAGLVAYLSSEESGFITGASLTIDGGFNI